jgi:tRNA (guanine-N7-)-methyltransferase
LPDILQRHQTSVFLRPPAAHARQALETLDNLVSTAGGKLILDSGCGCGESSFILASTNPTALVIGADKSAARIARARARRERPENLVFLHIDLLDCWSHIRARGWPLTANYLFYPNPWPKQHHLMRRWHAHPIMPTLLALGGSLELRSNWRPYVEEFAYSTMVLSARESVVEAWLPTRAISAFERKYCAAGHALYRVCVGAANG